MNQTQILRFHVTVRKLLFVCALAYSVASYSIEMPNLPCKYNPYADIQRVALYTKGKDNRKSLDKGGPNLGLSEEEMQRIRVNTGKVVCSGTKYGNPVQASASLVGNTGHVLTNAHFFIDERTKKFREPLSDCYFENKDTPPSKVLLAIQPDHKDLIIGEGYPTFNNADYAIAKLATPVANANPFPIVLNKKAGLIPNSHTIVVSNVMRLSEKLDPKQPIVQGCDPDQKDYGNPDAFWSKCDMFEGGSGSAHLFRSPSGELQLRAIVVGGYNKADRVEYNPKEGKGTYSVEVNGKLVEDLLKADPTITAHHGAVYN